MRALNKPELDLVEIEDLIKSEPGLCYRFLRYLNSPAFYLQREIRSVLHGLALMGETELRKWLMLVYSVLAGGEKKAELITSTLVRARFAELLGREVKVPPSELFILAMLSRLDAILDVPLDTILEQVAVPDATRAALLGQDNRLRQTLDLVASYEAADQSTCDSLRRRFRIPDAVLTRAYLDAVKWVRSVSAG